MNALLQSTMVSPELIYFLLIIPFVVMVATFARHVLGIKVLGIYVLVSMAYILGFTLRNNTILSIGIGTGILLFVYLFSYLVKKVTVELGLHYFSRISLVITMISILLLITLVALGIFPQTAEILKLNEVRPFAVVIAVFLSEHFSSNQTQKGIKKSRELFFNSLILTFGVSFIISWNKFEVFSLQYPYIAVGYMLLTLLFGRYKGARLSELFRFKDIKSERLND